jgi:hypothetical protein
VKRWRVVINDHVLNRQSHVGDYRFRLMAEIMHSLCGEDLLHTPEIIDLNKMPENKSASVTHAYTILPFPKSASAQQGDRPMLDVDNENVEEVTEVCNHVKDKLITQLARDGIIPMDQADAISDAYAVVLMRPTMLRRWLKKLWRGGDEYTYIIVKIDEVKNRKRDAALGALTGDEEDDNG